MTRFAFGILLLLPLTTLAAPVPKALKKGVPSLDGDWRWETTEVNGQINQSPTSDFNVWKVAGDTMTLTRAAGNSHTEPCALVSEPKTDGPRPFEYKVNSNGYHRRGVCELVDADTLRVAFDNDNTKPPAEVKSSANVSVYTFKRVKP